MRDLDRVIPAIKESVSAVEAAETLGLKPDRTGLCHCVWHADKTPSMKVYDGNRGCWCFACNHGGDVIDLVKQATGMTLIQSVEWLNTAFHLGLDVDRPMDKNAADAAEMARKHRHTVLEQQRAIEHIEFDLYCAVGKWLADLEADKERYRPRTGMEAWDERFVTAVKLIPEAKELAEQLAIEVIRK